MKVKFPIFILLSNVLFIALSDFFLIHLSKTETHDNETSKCIFAVYSNLSTPNQIMSNKMIEIEPSTTHNFKMFACNFYNLKLFNKLSKDLFTTNFYCLVCESINNDRFHENFMPRSTSDIHVKSEFVRGLQVFIANKN